ncbi:anthocyanidin 3-O-glucosyltransferase 4-like [Benincasa hispida]|uniref:anthocyanidin 3-O-glucosyltransferase 4-like n=1 Tax=Benincasa hispida TaxID=102211 RepID=UPI0019002834|nr:anthocyanidin 3-O-glucosyltransferase 4-like [Benincasa hispida]
MEVNAFPSAGRSRKLSDLMTEEPTIEAPVNGDRNYNGPKVAKFLTGVSVEEETEGDLGGVERVVVRRKKVQQAIEMVMDGDESEEMRKRCKEIGEKANKVVEKGGSCFCS